MYLLVTSDNYPVVDSTSFLVSLPQSDKNLQFKMLVPLKVLMCILQYFSYAMKKNFRIYFQGCCLHVSAVQMYKMLVILGLPNYSTFIQDKKINVFAFSKDIFL